MTTKKSSSTHRPFALSLLLSLLLSPDVDGFASSSRLSTRPSRLHLSDVPSSGNDNGSVGQTTSDALNEMMSAEAQAEAEFEYNEADFADYVSDYSDLDDDDDDREDEGSDGRDDDLDDDSSAPYLIDGVDYGFDLSPFEAHAREVFLTYAERVENGDAAASSPQPAAILQRDLYSMLRALDVDATPDEARALFKYLDVDDGGSVTLDEFLPWYARAVDAAQQTALQFQNLVKSRRTVHRFDATEVDDAVLRRAVECSIAAPNRRGTEPWRFVKLGRETVGKVVELRERMRRDSETRGGGGDAAEGSFVSWTEVPHWIVVTYPRAAPSSGPDGKMQQREDFKSTCCAVQNFLLSMWSEGIGTKWTDGPIQRTEEFAEICGIDLEKEKVAGVIWYGFAKGGLNKAQAKWRRKGVEEVLDVLP
mmetsp:Transcript_9343/g.20076  ORF Transcript_9343/g.20076 Transcript_9343/m.20076 type:complete len:421 (-) Transcript_9343:273-1535(-)